MPSFEFATANRIIFGAGKLNGLGDQFKGRAKRLLLVTGRSSDAIPRVREILSAQGIPFDEFALHGEPTVDTASEGVQIALEHGCDMVIGLGGGSVLDAGKAIAALATNPGDVLESPAHGVKVSLRSPLMLPSVALVDPELTYTLPPAITASTGLDALTQLIEPFVSVKANAMTDAICREGIRHAARSLRRAYENGADKEAREGMSLASLFGGMALANAALGAVHGFAGPLGGMLHAPHGAICARLLPLVMDANLRAMISREPNHYAIARYDEVAQILTGNKDAVAFDGVQWVSDLVRDLNIPMLSVYGLTRERFSEAVDKTMKASSTKGNPIVLSEDELREILEKAL